jgi:predicted glycoside hydrolase/deacetylase ChbG (UPF0249 family)
MCYRSTAGGSARGMWLHHTAKLVWVLAALVVAALCVARQSHAQTWAQRLGYPADKRVVILHASEMGLSFETNEAGRAALESGAVQSVGLMLPAPWALEFAEWAREKPDLDVGVDLTFTSERTRYRWKPVLSSTLVPSLVNADGFLWRSVQQVQTLAEPHDVDAELYAQIERARSLGLKPGHLSPHLGALVTRPDLFELYLRAARKYWIPAVVVELTPEHVELFRARGFPLEERIQQSVREYPLPKLDDLRLVPEAESYEAKRAKFVELIQSLRPGLTQVGLQPAMPAPALERIMQSWQQRVWEGQLLADEQVRAMLSREAVVLTNWKEVMRRFEGRSPTDDTDATP